MITFESKCTKSRQKIKIYTANFSATMLIFLDSFPGSAPCIVNLHPVQFQKKIALFLANENREMFSCILLSMLKASFYCIIHAKCISHRKMSQNLLV